MDVILRLFSALGANVVVTGRKADRVKRVAKEAQELSPNNLKPLEIVADVTKSGDLEKLMNETIKTFGKLDVLVNNAGIGQASHIKDPNFIKVFDNLIRLNLRAYLKLTHLAVPYLEATNGTVISISSIAGLVLAKMTTAYAISKAGGDIMTRTLALELGPRIRVNSISPGNTQTNINENAGDIDPTMLKWFEQEMFKRIPLQKVGQPLDMANGVAFLASNEAQYITGVNLVIDGGANIYYNLSDEDYSQVKRSRNFTGKVVLTTGSSSGIGEGIVKLFSLLGASVVVTGRNATDIHRVAKEVQELSPKKLKALEVTADVTKSDDLQRLLNETIKTYGKLDVLVNNAGIGPTAGVRDKAFMDVFDRTIDVNLRAYAELCHLAVDYLDQTNGTIISISSIASTHPYIANMAYEVSKSGVDMMTKVLALELGPRIRVNAINPGLVESNLMGSLPPVIVDALRKELIARTPLKRIGQPFDIAKGVAFLASTDAQFITGANLFIDGGLVYNVPGF
ncbi:unnamed protein product [Medioppia subpectinata]|uniref:Uncharacterized protein n=1 Tax=Medioppia subpectinata TaxID=1979941 RepID=A0A7R9KYV8_9ACAR|nr:unnamed protein product [Medioppia subpectinata]CAG2112433.1 unnamed protein product [Medioppia subpectinata]